MFLSLLAAHIVTSFKSIPGTHFLLTDSNTELHIPTSHKSHSRI